MKRKSFLLLSLIVVMILGFVVGESAYTGNILFALFSVIVGLFIIMFAKRHLDEVLEDERIKRVSDRASRKSLEVFSLTLMILSLSLMNSYKTIANVLSFVLLFLIGLYLLFYMYYNYKGLKE